MTRLPQIRDGTHSPGHPQNLRPCSGDQGRVGDHVAEVVPGVRIEGPRLNDGIQSFVGLYDIPYVYGLTPGELAEWINAKFLPRPCRLTVISMRGWARPMVWEDTGLKWVPTSPNIPSVAARSPPSH